MESSQQQSDPEIATRGLSTSVTMLVKAKRAVDSIGASPVEQDPATGQHTIKGSETDGWVAGWATITLLGVGGLLAGLFSMYWIVSLPVDIASAVLIVVAPICVYQGHLLRELGGFRGQHNQLRRSVNTIHVENHRLAATVDQLVKHNESLKTVETDLQAAARKSGAQVQHLLQIVETNADLQSKMRKQLQSQVVQQIMTAILRTDHDQDFCLAPAEVERLMVRLSHLPGVEFSPTNFKQQVATWSQPSECLTLTDACAIARTINQDLADDSQAIFKFSTRALQSERPPSGR